MKSLGVRAVSVCQYLVRGLEGITSVFSLVIVDVIAASFSRMEKLRLEVMWKASPRGSLGSFCLPRGTT